MAGNTWLEMRDHLGKTRCIFAMYNFRWVRRTLFLQPCVEQHACLVRSIECFEMIFACCNFHVFLYPAREPKLSMFRKWDPRALPNRFISTAKEAQQRAHSGFRNRPKAPTYDFKCSVLTVHSQVLEESPTLSGRAEQQLVNEGIPDG